MGEVDSDKEAFTRAQQLILTLNDARQKEIESVRTRMEEFLKGQLELQHKMEMVAKGQDSLKERFEMGVSKTLSQLDKKFDTFMIDWGRKQVEDELRDERIKDIKEAAAAADKKGETAIESATFYGKSILITIIGALGVGGVMWMFQKFHG